MSKNIESNEAVQWSYDFIQSFYLNNNESRTDKEMLYSHYLAPFGDKYFSPLNPFLLFGGVNLELLLKKDIWLLRDGLIPLSFFFKEASLDLQVTSRKFIIHKDFWFLVPEAWQKHVLFYEIKSKKTYGKGVVPEKMVLMGIANETMADSDEFVSLITELSENFTEKELAKMQITAYFPNKRSDLWGKWQDDNIFKYAKVMFEKLKMDIQFPEWDILKSTMDYQNTLYFEVNSGAIVKDTATTHMFLSRGAGLLNNSEGPNKDFKLVRTLPLSLYHEVHVSEFDFKKAKKYENPLNDGLMPYFKKIIEKGTNPRSFGEGWEKWYGSYIKKHYKNHGTM